MGHLRREGDRFGKCQSPVGQAGSYRGVDFVGGVVGTTGTAQPLDGEKEKK